MDDEKLNVLYVDDEENNLISFRAAFRRDYNIFTARSAAEGIVILHQQEIPVIITDQRMPEMTGVQFFEKILPEFPDSIRMILTGFSDIDTLIQAINNGGIFRYITKPWDENEMRVSISIGMNLYRLQQKNKTLLVELNQKVQEQEKILRIFQKYVPESVVKQVLNAQDEISVYEGETKEVSALFCDLRDFTELSARLKPGEVVLFLNCFYSLMADSVSKFSGNVNQFIGDEVFACFGAPVSYPENQINAVLCALDMLEQLKMLNKMFAHKFATNIQMGIGINTGEVVAGNLGSEDKIAYSIIGDTVNTAKRIEAQTKDHPNSILISQSTFEKVQHLFSASQKDGILLKGKKLPVTLYEISGKK